MIARLARFARWIARGGRLARVAALRARRERLAMTSDEWDAQQW